MRRRVAGKAMRRRNLTSVFKRTRYLHDGVYTNRLKVPSLKQVGGNSHGAALALQSHKTGGEIHGGTVRDGKWSCVEIPKPDL